MKVNGHHSSQVQASLWLSLGVDTHSIVILYYEK